MVDKRAGNVAGAAKRALQSLEQMVLPQANRAPLDFAVLEKQLRLDSSPDAVGVLSMLYLFGVPDQSGSCSFPHGFPRNMTLALSEISRGIELGCGLCHTLLGLLLTLGHPVALKHSRVWLHEAPLRAAFRLRIVEPYGTLDDIRESGIDAVPLAYLVGAQLGDDVGSMAYAFAEAYSLSLEGSKGMRRPYFSSLSRVPKPPSEVADGQKRCMHAAQHARRPAIAAARHAEGDPHRDWVQLPLGASDPFSRSKAYGDWLAARMEYDPKAKHAYGRAMFDGTIGHGRNLTTAAHVWAEAVQSGQSRHTNWNLLMLQMRGDYPAEDPQYLEAVLNGTFSHPWQKAMAMSYAYRAGIGGRPKNAQLAGIWLLRAADLGDNNAQLMAGKALRGEQDPVLDGIHVTQNATLSLFYLRMAARGGRSSATFMVADHDIHGNCSAAYETLNELSTTRHPVAFFLYAHARRSYSLGDIEGAGLRLLLLAEAGSWTATQEAAELLGTATTQSETWPCGAGWRRCSLALRLRLGRGRRDLEQLAAAAAALRSDALHESERRKAGDLARMAASGGNRRGLWEAVRWESCEPSGDVDAARGYAVRLWKAATLRENVLPESSTYAAPLPVAAVAVVIAYSPELVRWAPCSLLEYRPEDTKQIMWPVVFTAFTVMGVAGSRRLWRKWIP